MRKLILLLLLPLGVAAQQPQQQKFLPWLGTLNAVPASVYEVKMKCYDPTAGACEVAKLENKFASNAGNSINAINNSGSTALPQHIDTAQAMEIQKMTPEQQRAWAMQYAMQQQAAVQQQPARIASQAEKSLFDQYAALNASQGTYISDMLKEYDKLKVEFEAKMKFFYDQKNEFINSCSKLKTGAQSAEPDFECVQKGERNFQEWVANYGADWFSRVRSLVDTKRKATEARFTTIENHLVANGYFLNASNTSYTRDAAAVQLMIINTEMAIAGMVENAWEKGCDMTLALKISHELMGDTY